MTNKKAKNKSDNRFPTHMKLWEKTLTFSFLSLAIIVSALGVFQCISLITNIYFQADASTMRSANLWLVFLALVTFVCWSVASARLFSDFIARYLIPKS